MENRSRLSNSYCRPASDPLSDSAKPWQQRPGVQLIGAALAAAPIVAIALWMYVVREQPPTLGMMLGGPLVFGGILIVWNLLIHRVISGDRLTALGLKTDSKWAEVGQGVVLGIVLLALQMMLNPLLTRLFPPQPPPEQILELLGGLSRSPWLLALWLGPVVWFGIAGFEELWRVHMLRRLWRVLPGRAGNWAVIVGCATLVAGVHLYQPPAIMLSIGILSFLKGWYFMKTGRFWSMVVAHALFDSVQVVAIVIAFRGAGL
jgi:membrane protease YdiL (CAAX protease family)